MNISLKSQTLAATLIIALAGFAQIAPVSAAGGLVLGAPAGGAPNCQFGFSTVQKKSWILECSKTVPMAQKGVALTEAGNANCTPNAYWNFGPKVSAQHLRGNRMVKVSYICGHVEG